MPPVHRPTSVTQLIAALSPATRSRHGVALDLSPELCDDIIDLFAHQASKPIIENKHLTKADINARLTGRDFVAQLADLHAPTFEAHIRIDDETQTIGTLLHKLSKLQAMQRYIEARHSALTTVIAIGHITTSIAMTDLEQISAALKLGDDPGEDAKDEQLRTSIAASHTSPAPHVKQMSTMICADCERDGETGCLCPDARLVTHAPSIRSSADHLVTGQPQTTGRIGAAIAAIPPDERAKTERLTLPDTKHIVDANIYAAENLGRLMTQQLDGTAKSVITPEIIADLRGLHAAAPDEISLTDRPKWSLGSDRPDDRSRAFYEAAYERMPALLNLAEKATR